MTWFAIGIALWVLLLLLCWVALDCGMVSSGSRKKMRASREDRRPRRAAPSRGAETPEQVKTRTSVNQNEVSP